MKICPVCKAIAFDDAQTCFGCLHQFADGDKQAQEEKKKPNNAQEPKTAPEFLIRFTPSATVGGDVTWSCAVETVAS